MKRVILTLFIAASIFAANAQGARTMYVMKNNAVVGQYAVADIDSIIFYKPVISGVLINGVVWATCNVAAPGAFADSPTDAGMLYQWNRKIGWSATNPMVNSNGETTWNSTTPTGTTWETANDPSPAGWRVPTTEEQQTLLDASRVSSQWVEQNGVWGRKFTDLENGNFIFLPAVGYRDFSDGTLYGAGSYGYYWSSTQSDSYDAYLLFFLSSNVFWNYFYDRKFGFSVRPVAE